MAWCATASRERLGSIHSTCLIGVGGGQGGQMERLRSNMRLYWEKPTYRQRQERQLNTQPSTEIYWKALVPFPAHTMLIYFSDTDENSTMFWNYCIFNRLQSKERNCRNNNQPTGFISGIRSAFHLLGNCFSPNSFDDFIRSEC